MASSEENPECRLAIFTDKVNKSDWWRGVEKTLTVEINESLSQGGWRSLMTVLRKSNVSIIKHLILPLDFEVRSDDDMLELAQLLVTCSRFHSLETLHLQTKHPCPSVVDGKTLVDKFLNFPEPLSSYQLSASCTPSEPEGKRFPPGTLSLGKALSAGNVKKLKSLALSNCYAIPILQEIVKSSFQLQSFCLSFLGDIRSSYKVMGQGVESLTLRDYRECLRQMPSTLRTVFESGCFKCLERLELTYGALGGEFADIHDLVTAMSLGQLPALKCLRISGNHFFKPGSQLADLVVRNSFRYLESLQVDDCRITAGQVIALVHKLIEHGDVLWLQRLDLQSNYLGHEGVDAILKLAKAGLTPQLRDLDLSGTTSLGSMVYYPPAKLALVHTSFTSLLMAIENGHFPGLDTLDWRRNSVDEGGLSAMVIAYSKNQAVTVKILIDEDSIRDSSFLVTANQAREKNLRLTSLRTTLENEEKKKRITEKNEETKELKNLQRIPASVPDVNQENLPASVPDVNQENLPASVLDVNQENSLVEVPVVSAKVFLCGYPEVGKTTLRKSLTRSSGILTKIKWERRPTIRKERRTRGIELSRIQETTNWRSGSSSSTWSLVLWDMAGQQEFHVMHGSFLPDLGLAAGRATTFVLVLKAKLITSVPAAKGQLLYWLRFAASSSRKQVKRRVVIVLNCFNKEKCADFEVTLWKGLIKDCSMTFHDWLHVHQDPFYIDCRVASTLKELKEHLFAHAKILLEDVSVPEVCLTLQQRLRDWSERKGNRQFPILGWDAFLRVLKEEGYQISGIALDAAASYLHELGEIIYFNQEMLGEPGSKSMSLIVPSPEWFCKRVVGELLLPKEMIEDKESSVRDVVEADGSMSITQFQVFFEELLADGTRVEDIISMLVRLGLCYRLGVTKIVVPALIKEDDLSSLEWEAGGLHWVMGRSLTPGNETRVAIPMTLFRRLQVELAQDGRFGGRGDSAYQAGKSFSTFKIGELLVLIQFDTDSSNPTDHRVDILVKSFSLEEDPDLLRLEQIACICAIVYKLECLIVQCCPGLTYEKNVIKPWHACEPSLPMSKRVLMSVIKIKSLVEELGLGKYLSWKVKGQGVRSESLLSLIELQELRSAPGRAYNARLQDVVTMGLLPSEDIESIDEAESSQAQEPPKQFMVAPSLGSDRNETITKSFLREQFLNVIDSMNVIHGEVTFTRQQLNEMKKELNDSLSDARRKQNLLLRRVQALQSFSIQEQERSVPRYLFLSKHQYNKPHLWISLTEAFQTVFRMHFLCEARFEDGLIHEVEDQDGIEIKKKREWLVKISPWFLWSLKVAIVVAKIGGSALFPGLGSLIPNFQSSNAVVLSTAVDSVATLLTDQLGKEKGALGIESLDPGSAKSAINLKEKLIAEAVVADLMREIGQAVFVQKIGLRKVLLNPKEFIHWQLGSSSTTESSVAWICQPCWMKYGTRVTDITPQL